MLSRIAAKSAKVLKYVGFALLTGLPHPAMATESDEADSARANAIVQKADEVRLPQDAFEASVAIETTGSSDPGSVRRYKILSKGNENTIVMVTEPASERGQIMLMKGHDLWVFLPNVSQPVRISLSQRLTGQVANGDLARANFAGDYDAKLVRTETIDGEDMYVLELVAKERSVTYHRVLYWVRKSNDSPYKAEFYGVSGKLLKTCRYENFKRIAGRVRPTRLVMEDPLHAEDHSVMQYSDIRLRDLPDRMFTKDYLKRLE